MSRKTGPSAGELQAEYSAERKAELQSRLEQVRRRISLASAAAGRVSEPELIVVSKFFPASDACALADLGVKDLGENRDQEAAPKSELLAARPGAQPAWHFIGQLQTNKAKSVVRYADAVHSVDRLPLVTALDRAMERALEAGQRRAESEILDCLVQVSLDPDSEPGRGGVQPVEVEEIAAALIAADHLRLRGIMAVAPLGADPDEAFGRLTGIHEKLVTDCPGARWISAGMSQDLESAIAHGATHVRIGSDVLGPRH